MINVAQGALIILGAYLSYELFTRLQIDPFVSILVLTPLHVPARGRSAAHLHPPAAQRRA